jgi:hypothetical protein
VTSDNVGPTVRGSKIVLTRVEQLAGQPPVIVTFTIRWWLHEALLGHATIDTVMVYAKLYPQTLVEEYRKAARGLYIT